MKTTYHVSINANPETLGQMTGFPMPRIPGLQISISGETEYTIDELRGIAAIMKDDAPAIVTNMTKAITEAFCSGSKQVYETMTELKNRDTETGTV